MQKVKTNCLQQNLHSSIDKHDDQRDSHRCWYQSNNLRSITKQFMKKMLSYSESVFETKSYVQKLIKFKRLFFDAQNLRSKEAI